MSDFNLDNPLARIKGETLRAFHAFHDYVDMGPGRSLPLLSKGYSDALPQGHDLRPFFAKYRSSAGNVGEIIPTKRQSTLERWSSVHHWQARLARLLEIRAAQRETVRLKRMRELEDADWRDGQELREKVTELLKNLEEFSEEKVSESEGPDGEIIRTILLRFKPSLTQLSTTAKIASELQRLAVGAATQNRRLVDKEGEDRDLPIVSIEVVKPE